MRYTFGYSCGVLLSVVVPCRYVIHLGMVLADLTPIAEADLTVLIASLIFFILIGLIRAIIDNINVTNKNYTMTLQNSFQLYYSKEFKLFDLTIYTNKKFHSHYHLTSLKDVNDLINKYK